MWVLDHGVVCGEAHLPESAARLYRMLGQLPGVDFSLDLVVALGHDQPTELRRVLAILVEVNLVRDKGNKRYALHGLVRRHARRLDENPAVWPDCAASSPVPARTWARRRCTW